MIDVLNGIVVHGLRGERKRYQPIKSILIKSIDPMEIASAFNTLGFTYLYLADLDAILGKSINFSLYRQIIRKTNLNLMIDAGITDMTRAQKVIETGVPKIVIGSETLDNLNFIHDVVRTFGEDKVLVSIDQKKGKLLSASETIVSMDAVFFAQKLANLGVRKIIFLDLDRVGTEYGINLPLIENLIEKTGVDLLVGGGIRNLRELEKLRTCGVFGALIATVLHNGKVSLDKLKALDFL